MILGHGQGGRALPPPLGALALEAGRPDPGPNARDDRIPRVCADTTARGARSWCDNNGRRLQGRLMETTSDWMPSRFHAFLRFRGRLRRLPMTFDDSETFRASQSRSIFLPSR